MNEMSNKWIGQRTIRPDGADKVTGRAAFAADTAMAGMIWGKVLRSPHPHARILGSNTSKAEALSGVKAVMTAADNVEYPVDTPVPLGIQDMRWMCRNVMAREKALFHGHPVAAVAATFVRDRRRAPISCISPPVSASRPASSAAASELGSPRLRISSACSARAIAA